VGGRVAAVVAVIAVGVVHRVHRRRYARAVTVASRRRGRHRRAIAVVVVAVGAGACVDANPRRGTDDHPTLGARSSPVEADRLKVLEGSEAVQLVAHLVVGHDGERNPSVDAVHGDVDGDSLDATGVDLDVLVGVVVAVVGVEVEVNVPSVGVVADVFHVIVDRDRVVVVHHHGL